jgi:hypothetical protein
MFPVLLVTVRKAQFSPSTIEARGHTIKHPKTPASYRDQRKKKRKGRHQVARYHSDVVIMFIE